MQYIVTAAQGGMLLRSYLTAELGLSHRLISRLKRENGMLLNGTPVTVRAQLREGDVLSLAVEDGESQHNEHICPVGDMPPILYEDDAVLLCAKSGSMPTHPSHGHTDDTLANAVAAYDLRRDGHVRAFRPITRLDRETSGVVLLARSQAAAARLSRDIAQRRMQKAYLAILDGTPSPIHGSVDMPIRRAQQSIILRMVCAPDAPGAQAALTHYRTLVTWQQDDHWRSLVLALPQTGRTHQLRVHFAHLGTPIAGDGLYGRTDLAVAITPPRQCLHAYSLAFTHPITGDEIHACAPLPEDILTYLPTDVRTSLPSLLAQAMDHV